MNSVGMDLKKKILQLCILIFFMLRYTFLVTRVVAIKILDVFLTTNELQILGINMSVGIDGRLGKPMIREGQGLDIFVRRSLRDVFRKVPTFSLEVKVTPIPSPNV